MTQHRFSCKLKNWLLPIEAINAREPQSHKPVNTQQCSGVGDGGGGEIKGAVVGQ